jgi:hypothetical protein
MYQRPYIEGKRRKAKNRVSPWLSREKCWDLPLTRGFANHYCLWIARTFTSGNEDTKIMRIRIAVVVAMILLLASSVASARDIPAVGFTIDDVVTWLQSSGHSTQVVTGSDGKRHVSTSIGGVGFGVYMFDCKEDRCGSIQFAAGLASHGRFDISRMNEWNTKQRWGRGYYDSSNDPWVQMDVDLTPGGTYELLDDELATWNTTLAKFVAVYGLK